MNGSRILLFTAIVSLATACGTRAPTDVTDTGEASASSALRKRLTLMATPSSQKAAPALSTLGRGVLAQAQCHHQTFALDASRVLLVPDVGWNLSADSEVFDLTTSSWTATPAMTVGRSYAAASKLQDGRILVTGGTDGSTELFEASGVWVAGPPLLAGERAGHIGVTLQDGRVLIAGGTGWTSSAPILGSELFDPATSTWTTSGEVSVGRFAARASVLGDGRVLMAGGYDASWLATKSVELFDPTTGRWTSAAPMLVPRADFALTALLDGRLLATGGYDDTGLPVSSAELFDPLAGTWTLVPSGFSGPRAYHGAVQLDASRVMVVGGVDDQYQTRAAVEILDLATLQWTSSGELNIPRQDASLELLPDGRVLAIAGCTSYGAATISSETWSPTTGEWTTLGGLPRNRSSALLQRLSGNRLLLAGGQYNASTYPPVLPTTSELIDASTGSSVAVGGLVEPRLGLSSVVLHDGRVLAFGGRSATGQHSTTTELFDPQTNHWTLAGPLAAARGNGPSGVLLGDGRVLVTGGSPTSSTSLATAELFDPQTGTWTPGAPMATARAHHQSLRLGDGRVLVVGGKNGAPLATTELYDPVENAWTAGPTLNFARYAFSAALAGDGTVVVAGGPGASTMSSSEFLDAGLSQWVVGGALGYPHGQPGVFYPTTTGLLVLVGGGASPVEVVDPVKRTWEFFGPKLATTSLMHPDPVVSFDGAALAVESAYSDDVLRLQRLATHAPVSVSTSGGVAPITVTLNGDGVYDAAAGVFFPPFGGAGSSALTARDARGDSRSVTVRYSAAPRTPVALTLSGSTTFPATRLVPASSPKTARTLTLQVDFAGTRHATAVAGSGLSGDFAFAGGAYPGTGGTCGAEISRACTIVVQFSPSAVELQTATGRLRYLDGSTRRSTTFTLAGTGERIDPAQHVLVIYNTASPDSVSLKDYYLAHRPGLSSANVLGLSTTTQEVVADASYTAQIETPFVEWLQNHPDKPIRYVVWMYGLPTRTSGGTFGGATYRLSRALQTRGLSTGTEYRGTNADQYSPEAYPGTTALVTAMNMGSVEATIAYIDKVVAMWAAMPSPDLVVSASASGQSGTSSLIQDARGYSGFGIGQTFYNGLMSLNPEASATYVPQSSALVNQASDLLGYFSWGVHAGLPATYAVDGTVTFSGRSSWFLIATAESFNGQKGCSQGCFTRWFASNAWGGANFSRSPAGGVTHVEEPYTSGINGAAYFAMWEAGYLFSEAAWRSRNTAAFLAVGDPLITK